MTKFIQFLSLIIVFTLTFSSCKKEEPLQPNNTHYIENGTYPVEGITWVLVDARVYRDNLDNGEKDAFDHFGGTKFSSCMNMYGSAAVLMDSIHQNLTTWVFNNGTFTLDGTYQFPYTVYDNRVWTPNGLAGGTSRPIEVTHINDISMTVRVHEAYGSDGTYSYEWFNELTFIKSGENCNNCQPDVKYGYVYNGVWQNTTPATSTLSGTKWVVTKYYDGFSNNYPNDTLHFVSNNQYTINGGTTTNYTLSGIFGNNMSEMTLYGFYTIGGDFSGMVPNNFVINGQINSALFTDIFNTNNDKLVWMDRIQ